MISGHNVCGYLIDKVVKFDSQTLKNKRSRCILINVWVKIHQGSIVKVLIVVLFCRDQSHPCLVLVLISVVPTSLGSHLTSLFVVNP